MRARLVPTLAIVLTLALAGSLHATPPPPAPSVVSTAWLAEQIGAVAMVDARPSLKAYLSGHLPGAQPLSVENLRSAAGGVPGVLLPWDTVQVVARRLGLGIGKPVVVYAEESDVDATYVASVLRLAGLPQVAVLDGGFKRWSAEKRPVTTERKVVPLLDGTLCADARAIATIEDVKKALETKGAILLDARPAEAFAAGHIPGAKSRFWMKDVADGTFRGEAEVKAELKELGVTGEAPVIVYCNTGHMASELFYTLRYRLGWKDVRLYNGSWLEWAITPGTPRETSPVPPPG